MSTYFQEIQKIKNIYCDNELKSCKVFDYSVVHLHLLPLVARLVNISCKLSTQISFPSFVSWIELQLDRLDLQSDRVVGMGDLKMLICRGFISEFMTSPLSP